MASESSIVLISLSWFWYSDIVLWDVKFEGHWRMDAHEFSVHFFCNLLQIYTCFKIVKKKKQNTKMCLSQICSSVSFHTCACPCNHHPSWKIEQFQHSLRLVSALWLLFAISKFCWFWNFAHWMESNHMYS